MGSRLRAIDCIDHAEDFRHGMVAQERIVATAPAVLILQSMLCHYRIDARLKVHDRLRQIFQLFEPPTVSPSQQGHMNMGAAYFPRYNIEVAADTMPHCPLRLQSWYKQASEELSMRNEGSFTDDLQLMTISFIHVESRELR